MDAQSVATAILDEVEDHLVKALALLDAHGLGKAAAPHIDLGLHHIHTQLAGLALVDPARSAG
jgi:hypothetical protein